MKRSFDLTEEQETLASLYALGALERHERASFERAMDESGILRDYVAQLCDIHTDATIDSMEILVPDANLKESILSRIDEVPVDIIRAFNLRSDEGFVMTDLDGRIQWVNSEFTSMCGYELPELKGKKPGHMLQGPATDPSSVNAMRTAFKTHKPINVEMVNYHKNGNPYWVSISMSPILDENRAPRCYVAIEREIRERDTPVMLA